MAKHDFSIAAYKAGIAKAEKAAEESTNLRIAVALERIATALEKQDDNLGSVIQTAVADALFNEWREGRRT
jgi:hypothetical protein